MAKDLIQDLKKQIETKKTIIGAKEVMRELFNNKISDIYLSSNCPEDIRQDIDRYAATTQVNIVDLDLSSDEFGITCKKSFPISILGILKS